MTRRFQTPDGGAWEATIVSHGRTSGYLNPKVHRPIVEFRPLESGARRYAALPREAADLEALDDDDLVRLLGGSSAH